MPERTPPFFTLSDVARHFGVSPTAVRYWLRRAEIDILTLPGGKYYITARGVEQLARLIGQKKRKRRGGARSSP